MTAQYPRTVARKRAGGCTLHAVAVATNESAEGSKRQLWSRSCAKEPAGEAENPAGLPLRIRRRQLSA
jgi:hypothetical protein